MIVDTEDSERLLSALITVGDALPSMVYLYPSHLLLLPLDFILYDIIKECTVTK